MIKQRKKRILSEDHKNKIRLSCIGKNTWMKGRKMTAFNKEQLIKANTGRPSSRKGINFRTLKECLICKNTYKAQRSTSDRSKYCSIKCRGLGRRGINSNFWKGGISSLRVKIYNSLEYKLWRESVFKRDDYTCIWCGAQNGSGKTVYLEADHIKPFSLYPELRFAIDNGRTLCKPCHKKTDTYGSKCYNKYKSKSPINIS